MKKITFVLVALCAMFSLFVSCENETNTSSNTNPLVGNWVSNSKIDLGGGNQAYLRVVIKKDTAGMAMSTDDKITWMSDSQLFDEANDLIAYTYTTTTFTAGNEVFNYTITGNTLTLSGASFGTEQITFSKQ